MKLVIALVLLCGCGYYAYWQYNQERLDMPYLLEKSEYAVNEYCQCELKDEKCHQDVAKRLDSLKQRLHWAHDKGKISTHQLHKIGRHLSHRMNHCLVENQQHWFQDI